MTLNLTVTRCACVLAACSVYYGYRARKYFAARYGERLRVVDGDSTRTVPSYLASHPEVRCDLIVVDGAHNYVGPVLDAVNLMHAGSCGTHLIMDDVCDPASCHAHGPDGRDAVAQIGPTQAWTELKRAGYARELQTHFDVVPDRGWVHGMQTCSPEGLPNSTSVGLSAAPTNVVFSRALARKVGHGMRRHIADHGDATRAMDRAHRQDAQQLQAAGAQTACSLMCAA